MSVCSVSTCPNNYRRTTGRNKRNKDECVRTDATRRHVTYHVFPRDAKLAQLWLQKCGRRDINSWKSRTVCSDHFGEGDYEDDMKHRLMGLPLKKFLKKGAVPHLLMPVLTDNSENVECWSGKSRRRWRNNIQNNPKQLGLEHESGVTSNSENVTSKAASERVCTSSEEFQVTDVTLKNLQHFPNQPGLVQKCGVTTNTKNKTGASRVASERERTPCDALQVPAGNFKNLQITANQLGLEQPCGAMANVEKIIKTEIDTKPFLVTTIALKEHNTLNQLGLEQKCGLTTNTEASVKIEPDASSERQCLSYQTFPTETVAFRNLQPAPNQLGLEQKCGATTDIKTTVKIEPGASKATSERQCLSYQTFPATSVVFKNLQPAPNQLTNIQPIPNQLKNNLQLSPDQLQNFLQPAPNRLGLEHKFRAIQPAPSRVTTNTEIASKTTETDALKTALKAAWTSCEALQLTTNELEKRNTELEKQVKSLEKQRTIILMEKQQWVNQRLTMLKENKKLSLTLSMDKSKWENERKELLEENLKRKKIMEELMIENRELKKRMSEMATSEKQSEQETILPFTETEIDFCEDKDYRVPFPNPNQSEQILLPRIKTETLDFNEDKDYRLPFSKSE